MTFAGTPPTMAYGGTSLVTTEPAAITEPVPIQIPDFNNTSCPIQTSFPTIIPVSLDLCGLKGI